jgi:hypothetical protein
VSAFVEAAATALGPLRVALADREALTTLLRDLGWSVPVDEETFDRIRSLLPVAAALDDLADDPTPVEMAQLVADVGAAIETLAQLGTADVEDLPDELGTPAFWADLAAALPGYLLARHLRYASPVVAGLLRLTGIERLERGASGALGPRFDWGATGRVLADPAGAVAAAYGWPGEFRDGVLVRDAARALSRLGLRAALRPMAPAVAEAIGEPGLPMQVDVRLLSTPLAEAGFVLASARTEAEPVGLFAGTMLSSALLEPVRLGKSWELVAADMPLGTATAGAVLRPDGLTTVGPPGGGELRLEGRPELPWLLLGSRTGTRLQVTALDLAAGVDADELWLSAGLPPDGLEFVLDLGVADSFVRGVAGDGLSCRAGGTLRWSSRTGLGFTAGAGLGVDLPLSVEGVVSLTRLRLAAEADGDGARFAVLLSGSVELGPVLCVAEDIGAALVATPRGGGLDALDLALEFVPPSGWGISVDVAGVVEGGGFVAYDADTGRYTGAASFEVLEVGLAAMGVLDTRLPGEPDGWSLFASVSATFPGLPLGFGFVLLGVGGIACVNRTMDTLALAGAVKSGAADALMFPEDPVADVQAIAAQLDTWFPRAEGNTCFGVSAKLGWGTPAVITAEVGVLISLPEGELAILGSVASVLPDEDTALVELHMDTLGAIDPSEGTVLVTAGLYDSTLARTIHLSGEMAAFARFTAQPYFLLSVGGYHPHFVQPPCADLPAVVTDLDRMRAEIAIGSEVSLAVEAYFAVTSNTVQFGAVATLEATAEFLLTTYTARGWIGFDVLLMFDPFSFRVEYDAGVSVTAGDSDRELLAVTLHARLEGPKPWHAVGRARFDFFGIDVRFRVDVGSSATGDPDELVDVRVKVRGGLTWRTVSPSGGVVIAGEAPEGELWARPDAELEAVQSAAPLARALDCYGQYELEGASRVDVVGAGVTEIGALEWHYVDDWFAPAQYHDLSEAEKLSMPSYEPMAAGVRFGAPAVTLPAAALRQVVTPEPEVHVIDRERTRKFDDRGAVLKGAGQGRLMDRAQRPKRGAVSPKVTMGPTPWCRVDPITGKALSGPRTYIDVLDDARGGGRVAPVHAATEEPAAA